MATAVITIRPFATFDRSAHDTFSLEWAIRAITSGEFAPDHNLFCQLPEFTPATPVKPHWFKRLYQNALARFTLSVRVSQEVAAKLKSIIGWHDKLRRYMDVIAKNVFYPPQHELSPIEEYDCEYESRLELPETFDNVGIFERVVKKIRTTAIFRPNPQLFVNFALKEFKTWHKFDYVDEIETYISELKKRKAAELMLEGKPTPYSVYYGYLAKELFNADWGYK